MQASTYSLGQNARKEEGHIGKEASKEGEVRFSPGGNGSTAGPRKAGNCRWRKLNLEAKLCASLGGKLAQAVTSSSTVAKRMAFDVSSILFGDIMVPNIE